MKLNANSQCVKYLMFIFNLIFVITGIILLTIGLVIHGVYHDYQHFLDNKFLSVPSLLIAIGTIIFFIAFFGCCGAVRENYCMIVTFTCLLVIVFIMELAGGISGYVLRARASEVIQSKMIHTMHEYNHSKEIQTVWDELQENFGCCGTHNASDWLMVGNNGFVPESCCKNNEVSLTTNCTVLNAHPDGCFPQVLDYVRGHALQLGGFGIGIAFVQAIGVWFSIYLARSIRGSYETV